MSTPTSTERWQHVTQIVNDCLELPAHERLAHARDASGNDEVLFHEVMQWVNSAEQTEGFLAEPATLATNTDQSFMNDVTRRAGEAFDLTDRRLGAYRITEEIARGGMGSVFKAVRDDDHYQKVVAIKLIRPGMDSAVVVERFKAERQILANLDHPNIARLVDGGSTDDGTPYFVMEYVVGLPIDVYCEQKSLTVNDRLSLVRTVCAAVHFAHQRLVVHRDLKPSNILVDDTGQVKLLDFGIAKLIDPTVLDANGNAMANPTVANAMTPAYASPEQVKGEAITTASDVYALGVLLYRLLTGKSPYKNDATKPLELAKEIVDTDPERPSTVVNRSDASRTTTRSIDDKKVVQTLDTKRLQRELRGDLDNIVLMALRKDPQRRYASAEQFAEDVRRCQSDLPVLARTDTFSYRAKKFTYRNRWSVSVAFLASLALLSTTISALYQAYVAKTEKMRAEKYFADVRKLANTYLFEVHDAVKNLPGATQAREMLVKNSLTYLDQLSRDASDDLALISEIAAGYDKLGDVQGAWRAASLGDTKGAEVSFRKAIDLRSKLLDDTSETLGAAQRLETQRLLIVNRGKLSELLVSSGRFDEGIAEGERALKISESLAGQRDSTATDKLNVVRGRFSIASQRITREGLASAATALDKSLNELSELEQKNSGDKLIRRVGAAMYNQGGVIFLHNAELQKAKAAFSSALRLTEINRQAEPGNPQFDRMKMFINLQSAETHFRAGDIALAEVHSIQLKAIPMAAALSDADPKNQRYAMDVAVVRQWAADKQSKLGYFSEASTLLATSERELLAIFRSASDPVAQANLQGVRFQSQYVVAHAIVDRKRLKKETSSRCNDLNSDTAVLVRAIAESTPESTTVLPSVDSFKQVVASAQQACMQSKIDTSRTSGRIS
jgi:serine/threonine protein kinase